ncbi:MAG: ZIP family metal transporter [Flavobacteriales bacterium]
MNTEEYIVLIGAVLLIGSIFLYARVLSASATKLLNAFSAAFLIGICFTDILPESYELNPANTGIFVIIGFLTQLLLGVFSGGIEHGHAHPHKHEIPYAVLASLGTHAFIEGWPLNAHTHLQNEHLHHAMVTGILVHNIPITIVLTNMLKHSGLKNGMILLLLAGFSLLTPLGAICANNWFLSQEMTAVPLAIVAGILLHISTTILFEAADSHKFNLIKMVVILLGLGLALFI